MYRDQEYWTEKVELMIEDYNPRLPSLMEKKELTQFTEMVARQAEKSYRQILSKEEETNPMTEMSARENAEELIEEMLNKKQRELTNEDEENEDELSELDMELMDEFMEWIQTP